MRKEILLGLSLLMGVGAFGQAPAPKILNTWPGTGAAAVDTTLNQIKIEFDQDMAPGMSFPGGGNTMPQITGRPTWETRRTIVIPVKLRAGQIYVLKMNGGSFTKFRSITGVPLAPASFIFHTQNPQPEDVRALNKTSFQEFQKHFLHHYSHLTKTGRNWKKELAIIGPQLEAETSSAGFTTQLLHLLSKADDGHLWVQHGNDQFSTAPNKFRIYNYNFSVIESQLQALQKSPSEVVVSGQQDSIGYLRIATWSRDRKADLITATTQLKAMAHLPHLIIDVRENGGGDDQLAQEFASHFITQEAVYEQVTVFDEKKKRFSKVHNRTISPATDFKYQGKVYVLMGESNASSTESFLLMMRQAPNVRLVGNRSMGSSGNPQAYKLANGVTVFLPSWRAADAQGNWLEGKGITPDVEIALPQAAYETADPVFEKVMDMITGQ